MPEVYGEPLSGDPFTDRRRTGVGGSDAGAILGVSPYASALSVYEDKRGISPDGFVPSERMVWGSRLESAVLQGYAEDTGRKVHKGRFLRSKRYPFVVGHPDALADDRLIEVKVTGRLDERWGPDGSDEVPAHYYAQVQHYLVLTDRFVADLAALVGGRELHIYTIPADKEFQDAMLEEEAAFWQQVQDGTPPDPDGSESAGAALRRMFPMAVPEEVIATPEVAYYVESYLTAKGMVDIAEAEMDRWGQLVQQFMGARERLVGPGFTATWANRAGRTSWQKVAAVYRDLLVPHLDDDQLDAIIEKSKSEPSRAFSVRKGADK
jgi:putative phage-type endonuclease